LLLAEAIGPTGHVTGLDLSPAFIGYATEMLKRYDRTDRISFQAGDVNELPFDDDTFDWVWSVDYVGYSTGDLLPVLQELARVVKPGGTVALLAWSSQCLLPGYPLLEARLNVTCSGLALYVSGKRPETHFLRALSWFNQTGLVEAVGWTFVADVQAPLCEPVRQALISLFQMLWGRATAGRIGGRLGRLPASMSAPVARVHSESG
jgi:demethylmenaquinone methyltransferase/2-methoxy-6-polyprenyl-1,4-benzoquinol methylase